MFDFFSNKLPATIRNFFTPSKDIHSYNTRSTELKLLKVPKVATSLFGVKSIFFKGPSTWNAHVRQSKKILDKKSKFSLKKYLKDFFVNSYEY